MYIYIYICWGPISSQDFCFAMARRLAYLLCLRLAAGGWVEVLNVDPSAGCPADWQLDSGTSGAQAP